MADALDRMPLSAAAAEFGGTLLNPDCPFSQVSIDSRAVVAGDLFVALIGERFDGHNFIDEVGDRACGLVVQVSQPQVSLPQWVVEDTVRALGQLAALKRRAFSGPVIAVTGSSGKTTVKEMIASILQQMGPVLATRGNLNNHIGVPLTLLSLVPKHEFAIVEMGASAEGDIAYLCEITKPDIVLVNNVMPAHQSGFGSLDATARAKGEIYQGMQPGGTAVLNLDEPYWPDWGASAAIKSQLTFALENSNAGVYATDMQCDKQGLWRFSLQTPIGSHPISLPIPGRHSIANAIAAAACAYAAGADLEEIAEGINNVKTAAGRMQFRWGVRGSTVVDDSYNANPGSVKAAIDTLCSLPGEPVLVLGDMAELGTDEREQHKLVGAYAASAGIAKLLAVGELSRKTIDGFGAGGEHFMSKEALTERLQTLLEKDTVVLVKGSRSARMETVVRAIAVDAANTETESPQGDGGD